MTTAESWRIRGDILEVCNCNVACPCNFGGDPSSGFCEAAQGYRIQEGNLGNNQLGGINFAMYLRMPGKPFEGNWTLGVYVDQQATEGQMQALGTILSGQAGGVFGLLAGLIGTALPPKQVPITFETVNGEHHVSVPGLLEIGSERIPSLMPGEQPLDTKASDLAAPFFTGPVSIRRSGAFSLTDPDLSFQHPGQSSFTGQFDFSGP